MTRSGNWSFAWTTSWDEIFADEYLARWTSLFADSRRLGPASPFFHPDVVGAWLTAHGGRSRYSPHYLSATSRNGQSLLLPMATRRTSWKQGFIQRLRPAGDRYFDYHDPIVVTAEDDDTTFDYTFWTAFLGELDRFGGSWFDDFSLTRVRDWWLPKPVGERLSDKAPYLDLTAYESFDAFGASLKKNFRGDLRRQMRRLEESGSVELVVYTPENAAECHAWVDQLERERAVRYPGSSLPDGYMASLIDTVSCGSPVHCSALRVGDALVSWHIGFCAQDAMFWYVPMFDSEWQNRSPGKVHLYLMIEWAFANGLHTFDFLRGQDAYKAGWTSGEEFRMHEVAKANEGLGSRIRTSAAYGMNKVGYVAARLRSMKT